MPANKGQKYNDEIRLGKLRVFHKKNIRRACMRYGAEIVDDLKELTGRTSGSGRVYFFKGRSYTASSPGEPPVKVSGRLNRSFKYVLSGDYYLTVGNTAFSDKGYPYPFGLEMGTSRMEARPYFIGTNKSKSSDLRDYLGDLY